MGLAVTEKTNTFNLPRDLTFRFFPAYAAYLLEHKLEAFATHQGKLVRQLQVPLLKYFESYSDEQFHQLAVESAKELLEALIHNKAEAYIQQSLERWQSNAMPAVTRDQIVVEDITFVWHARRLGFIEFLDGYTTNPLDWKNILTEIDVFITANETRASSLFVNVQQELYNQAQRLTGIGNYVWDISKNAFTWSDELYRIYEWEAGIPVDAARVTAATHPDDLHTAQEYMQQLFRTHEPYDYHYRIVTSSGRHKTLHARGTLQFDANGQPARMIGTLQDVTAQKESEVELMRFTEKLTSSEHRLAAILENAPDAVVVMDMNGLVEKWNAKAEQTFGWNEAEIIGKPLHLFIIPERFRSAHVEGLARFLRTGTGPVINNTVEISAVRRDGTEIDVSLSIAVASVDGRRLFTGFVRDITERKRAADKLAASENQFRMLVAVVKDYAIFMLNPEGIITTWNAGAQSIKQYTADEIIGKHFSTFYTDADRAREHPKHELEIAVREGRYEEEGWRVRKDGTQFWANVVITAIRDGTGQLRGFSKVTRDMTERMLASRRLTDTVSELERSNKELSSFSYAASHDLQEPLRKIQTFTSRILIKDAERLSDSSRDLFERLTNAAARMQRLIDDLLSYSRVGTQLQLLADVDLNLVLDDIRSTHKNLYGEKQVNIQAARLPTVHGSAVQLQQLFENLISNSIKYTRPGVSPVIRIEAETVNLPASGPRRSGRFTKIDVVDNGIGFEPIYNERIFEMFQRLHSRSQYEGTGIGLSIVKKIVQNHGGLIEAHGKPDVGATFSIYLPTINTPHNDQPVD